MMFFGGFWMIAFWAALVGLVIWGGAVLFKRNDSVVGTVHKQDSLDITRERYAKGEIPKEEYEEIKKTLLKHHV